MSELRDRALATVISWTEGKVDEVAQEEIVNDIFEMVREELQRKKFVTPVAQQEEWFNDALKNIQELFT